MKVYFLTILIGLLQVQNAQAQECAPVDILVVGDSQSGATWSRSYFGNFLQACLTGKFVVYGRGGTAPAQWLGIGGLDQIETIQRDPSNPHFNIGSGANVPVCKKRIEPMLDAHQPKKVLFEFGGNLIGLSDSDTINQIDQLMKVVVEKKITRENCYFLTPTFEMEVKDHRNVPRRNIQSVQKIIELIQAAIGDRCQLISGVELMKSSSYFDGVELLKRVPIEGLTGCGGAAVNDNVHVCGEAARDLSNRICSMLNSN